MNSLTRFETESGIELVINTDTGEVFATISGYARMSGRDKSTISRRMETVAGETKKTAEIQTTQGLRTVALIPASLVFEWAMKDKPELAKKMGACGATVYLHQLAGFKVKSVEKSKSTADMLIEFAIAYKEHETRLAALEKEKEEMKHELEAVSMEAEANTHELARFRNGHGYWFSIAGWCNKMGIKKPLGWMNAQGRKASALCRSRNIAPVPIADPRFGTVGTYPDSILAELNW